MSASMDDILKEIKALRKEVRDLKAMIIPEVEPMKDEADAVADLEKRKSLGKVEYTPLEALE